MQHSFEALRLRGKPGKRGKTKAQAGRASMLWRRWRQAAPAACMHVNGVSFTLCQLLQLLLVVSRDQESPRSGAASGGGVAAAALRQDGRHRCQAQVGCCCAGPRRLRAVQAPCKCAGALPACSAGHFARLGVFSSASERPWQRRGARRAPCKPCRRCRRPDRRLRACPLGPRSKKSKSKRLTLKQKYKVIRKVKEHHRKKRKEENKKKRLGIKPKEAKVGGGHGGHCGCFQ